ncbi:Gm12886 [Phodopus roborovskii]|uniref:Gm12886 protein n=1 Tax=Phodopus roborovskii TaxID=109678 RepID=A0AAU9ZF71_PHORO|nr:Gm12886 [Phodopus roborovskii]
MVFRGSQWLLSVCLLSWCCNTWELGDKDPESESVLTPLVIWREMDLINTDVFMKLVERTIPGVYVVPLEIGKSVIQDLENKALNASSEVCQILAENPKLHDGYISVTFSKRLQMLPCCLCLPCADIARLLLCLDFFL